MRNNVLFNIVLNKRVSIKDHFYIKSEELDVEISYQSQNKIVCFKDLGEHILGINVYVWIYVTIIVHCENLLLFFFACFMFQMNVSTIYSNSSITYFKRLLSNYSLF